MITTVDDLAAQISDLTGQTVTKVSETLEKMTPEDCASTAKVFGLDFVPNGRKRGRPRSPILELGRKTFPHLSARSQARLANAWLMLHEAGVSGEDAQPLLEDCERPNGSLNVAAFERLAHEVWWQRFVAPYVQESAS